MSMCPMCLAGLPLSCLTGSCASTTDPPTAQETYSLIPLKIETTDEDDSDFARGERRRSSISSRKQRAKRHLGNSQSSGRKEAARLYPLHREEPCEWSGLANVGGGDYPILGCLEGKQEARHHGPEKNVQNNEKGNVHRICHYCHYRWHAANDETYDWNAGIYKAHNPRPMTKDEQTFVVVDYMRYLHKGKRKKKEID